MANSDPGHCIVCNQPWGVVQPDRTKRPSRKAAENRSLLVRCRRCTTKKNECINGRPQNKQDEELTPPKVQPKTMSFMAFEEEMRQLAQKPDWTRLSVVICNLWNGRKEEMRPIFLRISCLVHEHTGYKFICSRSVE
jgi:hypothetical protein